MLTDRHLLHSKAISSTGRIVLYNTGSLPYYYGRNIEDIIQIQTGTMDAVPGGIPTDNGDSFPPSSASPPPQQQQQPNHPDDEDHLAANEQRAVIIPPTDVGVGVGVPAEPRMIGPQLPPPRPQQQYHSHSQQRDQEQELKQQDQDDMAYQIQQQQQQDPSAQTLKLWHDVSDNLLKHQTGELQ